jgi:FkbH-like protein
MPSKQTSLTDDQTVELMKGLLDRLNPDGNPYLVIHSDVLALKEFVNPVENSVRTFQEYAKAKGTTIFFPTFTPAVCVSGFFSNLETPTDTGLINNKIRELKGALRSNHPIDSYMAIGKDQEKVKSFFGDTLHGKNSACDFFHSVNARFILWGAKPSKVTMIHYYEFAINPSYRYQKTFKGVAVDEKGMQSKYEFTSAVKKRFLTNSYDFDHLDDDLVKYASYLQEIYNDTTFYSVLEKDLDVFISGKLKEEETYVLNDGKQVKEKQSQVRLSFLGSENLDLVKRILDETLIKFKVSGISCFQLPFDTYKQDLLSQLPQLYENGINYGVFCERIEVLIQKDYADLLREKNLNSVVQEAVDAYLTYVEQFLKKMDGMALVCDFVPFETESGFFQDPKNAIASQVCKIANEHLEKKLKLISGARIFKLSETVKRVGENRVIDRKLFFMGKIPYSIPLSEQFSFEIIGSVLESQGRTIRGVIVDLDNTLWGGIIGEDGMDQLALGSEFPGRAYRYFQKTLKELSARGILLALCSKNTEAVAMHAIENHPQMILRKKDFVSIRINWEHKSENIRAIAGELSLGLKNLAFIDDSPSEREEVSKILPDVLVPTFPEDACNLSEIFLNNPYFYSSSLTAEDLKRTERFQTTRQIGQLKSSEEDLVSFYRSLEMQAQLVEMNSKNKERVLSLIQKTNQFNTTSKRYTEKNLEEILSEGGMVYAIHYRDKLMVEGEDIGVVVTKIKAEKMVIDLFLMSCRYLNRTIETKVLSDLNQIALENGQTVMLGVFEPGERNSIVADLYTRHFFKAAGNNEFIKNDGQMIKAPDWFKAENFNG